MCLNPTYIVHPTLKRIANHCSFTRVRLEDVDLPFTGIQSFYSYPKKHVMSKNSDYVEQWYYLYNPETGERHPLFFACPCGHCVDCLSSKYSELSSRLQFEVLSYPPECRVLFFTLTYGDWSLPKDGVSRSDVTDFINLLHINAKRANLPDGFRTFIVSEYGTDPRFTHRPHYHGLIFGLDLSKYGDVRKFNDVFRKSWKGRGRSEWEFARSNHGVSKYCCKYVIKGLNSYFVPDGKNPNFISYPIKSGGLGVHALDNKEILDKILNSTDGTITVKSIEHNGDVSSIGLERIRIPRFIIDKLFPNFSRFIGSNIKRCLKWVSELWNMFQAHFITVGYKSISTVEKKFSYLRSFVDNSSPSLSPSVSLDRIKDYECISFVENDSIFDKYIKIYNRIVSYLENYKYDCQFALSKVAERAHFLNRIRGESRHVNSEDSYAYKSRFVSSCYKDSSLDAVFEL